MTPLKTALYTGVYGRKLIQLFLRTGPHTLYHKFRQVLTWLLSWLFWVTPFKGIWVFTLHISSANRVIDHWYKALGLSEPKH